MAEALMLEMDGDSDGSITEEELVSLFLPAVKNHKTQFKLPTVAMYRVFFLLFWALFFILSRF